MKRIVERPGALDVHKAVVTACVRVWEGRELTEHLAEFQTTVHGLLALRDWLEALAVKQVAMEATGVYWKPVWAILEDHFELTLVNARHVKAVPGRKTDIKDAQWLCQLLEAGLLKPSFVPPKPIRTLRNLTKHQTDCVSCVHPCRRRCSSSSRRIRSRGGRLSWRASGRCGGSAACSFACLTGRPARSR